MRYRHPKAEIHANGIYGGIGTRPAPEVWTPGSDETPVTEERVPSRFRRLRLRHGRARDRGGADPSSRFYLALGIFLLVAVAATAWAIVRSFG